MSKRYSTSFPTNENPLSEGGAWIGGATVGIDWHDLTVVSNVAQTTQSGAAGEVYSDAIANFAGSWGPDQTVEGLVKGPTTSGGVCEFVIHLRFSISTHIARGYEVTFGWQGDIGIGTWNGAIGDFTTLTTFTPSILVGDGSVIKATISGNVIKAYVNGVLVGSATDSNNTYTSGQPGFGCDWTQVAGSTSDFGWKSICAKDAVDAVVVARQAVLVDNVSAGTTLDVAISATLANSLIVVAAGNNGTQTISGVTDNATGGSNSYAQATNALSTNSPSLKSDIWYCLKAANAGATTVTITFAGSAPYRVAEVWEITGFTNALFNTANHVDEATGSGTTATGPSVTATYDDEFIAALCVPADRVITNPKLYNEFVFANDVLTNGTAASSCNPAFLGSHQPQWVLNTSGDRFAASIAAFMETPAPAVASTTPTYFLGIWDEDAVLSVGAFEVGIPITFGFFDKDFVAQFSSTAYPSASWVCSVPVGVFDRRMNLLGLYGASQ